MILGSLTVSGAVREAVEDGTVSAGVPRAKLERVRSIVIWCEPVRTAYASAALERS